MNPFSSTRLYLHTFSCWAVKFLRFLGMVTSTLSFTIVMLAVIRQMWANPLSMMTWKQNVFNFLIQIIFAKQIDSFKSKQLSVTRSLGQEWVFQYFDKFLIFSLTCWRLSTWGIFYRTINTYGSITLNPIRNNRYLKLTAATSADCATSQAISTRSKAIESHSAFVMLNFLFSSRSNVW